MAPPMRVCFVCSGNICRSPTAEVVFTALAERAGLRSAVVADSAGTGAWHAGHDMDARSRATLEDAGYRPGRHVARQFRADDFARRDLVVALDRGHRDALLELADGTADPAASRAKIVLLREHDPELGTDEEPVVADPYYGGPRGFTDVLAQVERSCAALLAGIAGDQQTESPPR